jgi:DNA-binding transcriptional regulator YhcF (GntR family)
VDSETTPANGRAAPTREQVAAVLRERIRSGALAPHASLPTQGELEQEFGVRRTVVRRALDILRSEGLVTSGRGAPATVVEQPARPPAPVEGPRPAGVLLSERVRAALAAEHVTIDVFCMTTETLNTALSGAIPALTDGELRPRSLRIRVLLPHPHARVALPRLVGAEEDARPRERSRNKARLYAGALCDQVEGLREQGVIEEAQVEIRGVPVTPVHKLYLLNGTESLLGYYQVLEHSVEWRKEELEIYDALGHQTQLFRSCRGPEARDAQEEAFVEESQLWFQSLWSTIARPFTLD